MRLLLDTHALLWWVNDAPALSRRARAAVADPENECLFSLASLWEMAIKLSLGKLELPATIEAFVERHLVGGGFRVLEIDVGHVARDAVFKSYGVKRLW